MAEEVITYGGDDIVTMAGMGANLMGDKFKETLVTLNVIKNTHKLSVKDYTSINRVIKIIEENIESLAAFEAAMDYMSAIESEDDEEEGEKNE